MAKGFGKHAKKQSNLKPHPRQLQHRQLLYHDDDNRGSNNENSNVDITHSTINNDNAVMNNMCMTSSSGNPTQLRLFCIPNQNKRIKY
eukprot:m.97258 g.97258  ORF g.97258 m.97258 type:complete len:88 (+) comp26960_c0_seq3:1084-1347(+)